MKVATSVTVWNDAVGKRMSITFSEVDDFGSITSDNRRIDRVLTDKTSVKAAQALLDIAQGVLGE